ncbi:tetratricopeptide repeat protein [Allomuricauda sp. R78024]|uniref:tetratricopeptide repeat protein n=1 Tax=Allomuricauda sp. R78024 TaxID=3093867 RepID=UPI0037CB2EEC
MKNLILGMFSGLVVMGCKSTKTLYVDEDNKTEYIQRNNVGVEVIDSNYKAENKNAGKLNREGIEFGRQGKFVKAKELFEEAIEIEDTNPAYYTNLGNCEMMLENYQAAESAHLKAIELDPRDSNPRIGLGATYNNWGKYQEADSVFNWFLENEEDYKNDMGLVYYNLADNRLYQDKCLEAQKFLEKAKIELGYETEAQKSIFRSLEGKIQKCLK